MLIRISLIVAIIASLAVGAVNFIQVKDKITALQTHLKDEIKLKETAINERNKTKKQLDQTQAELTQTKDTLAATTAERDKAVAEAGAQTKKAQDATVKLNDANEKLGTAQAELASYKASGLNPEQALTAAKQIKQLQDAIGGMEGEAKLLGQKIRELSTKIALYEHPEDPILLPKGLRGEVLVSDPKWDFVVLNIGKDQGILEHSELLVSRNGHLVGKIRIQSAQKDRSIANVMPGWKQGELMEGDLIIPAHPDS